MRSLAFIIIGLTAGILVTLIFLNSRASFFQPKQIQDIQIKTQEPAPTPSNQEVETKDQTITAGGKLSFNKFEVKIPASWTFEKTSSYEDQETLTLTDQETIITFNQAATGGNVCFFPGDPPTEIIFLTEYPYFEEIETLDGTVLRRAGDGALSKAYTVCSKGTENFLAPTTYGHISISTDSVFSVQDLNEVDQILSSLKKI